MQGQSLLNQQLLAAVAATGGRSVVPHSQLPVVPRSETSGRGRGKKRKIDAGVRPAPDKVGNGRLAGGQLGL
jgi:hypothetical protein